jgi:hypothetical protein
MRLLQLLYIILLFILTVLFYIVGILFGAAHYGASFHALALDIKYTTDDNTKIAINVVAIILRTVCVLWYLSAWFIVDKDGNIPFITDMCAPNKVGDEDVADNLDAADNAI